MKGNKNMSKNKYYLLTGLVGLLVTTAIIGSVSSASWNREEVKSIFESNDYSTWQEIMNDRANKLEEHVSKIRENITQENFDKMVEAHELMQSGNKEEARELMKELGFGGFGFGMKPGFRGHMFNK